MKKLNLRARELERLGFCGSELIRFIIRYLHPLFITAEKQEVLLMLKELHLNPGKFRSDPVWGKIVEKLKPNRSEDINDSSTKKGNKSGRKNIIAEPVLKQGRENTIPEPGSNPGRDNAIAKHGAKPGKYVDPYAGRTDSQRYKKQQSLTAQESLIIRLEKKARDYVIFGKELIEREALEQMETAMMLPVTLQGSLMADAHSGYGLPIGGVLAVKNVVIPYGVGMDIGCRMCLSVFDLPAIFIDNNRHKIREILIENTYFGQDEYPGKKEHEVLDRASFREVPFLREMKDKAYHQLGTSGHGNHFVDIGIVRISSGIKEKGLPAGEFVGILSHSGSRNFGASIAHHYTRIARDKCRLPKGAINLAWLDLDTEEGQEYWTAMNLAGDYSAANHHIIHARLAAALAEEPAAMIQNHHNYAWKEHLPNGEEAIVHRKGATPATTGVTGIIPGSMTAPAYIVRGRGNPASLNSASHGAGRRMSRSEAKRRFTDRSLRDALHRSGVELIGGGTDEAPDAYKDIRKIMTCQKDLVEILGTFEPRIVRMSRDR